MVVYVNRKQKGIYVIVLLHTKGQNIFIVDGIRIQKVGIFNIVRMNTRKKGRLIVKKAQNILETLGFLVQTANPKLKFIGPGKVRSMNEDFFGRWDLMAVHASRGYMKFIQVSVWEKQSEKIHQVEGFPNGDYSQGPINFNFG